MSDALSKLADHIGSIMVSTGNTLSEHLYRSDIDSIAESIFVYFGHTTRPWIEDMARAPKSRKQHIMVQEHDSDEIFIAEHRGVEESGDDFWVNRDNGFRRLYPVRWQPLPKSS